MKHLLNALVGLILATSSSGQEVTFARTAYGVASDGTLSADIVMNPAPAAGLFSGSVLVQVTGPNTVGFSRITMTPELNFSGPDGAGALGQEGTDNGSAAGTVDFFSVSKAFYQGGLLGTFEAGNFGMDGDYILSVQPNSVIGTPDEVLFVDGNCVSLDDSLSFGTANLTVGIIGTVETIGSPTLDAQSGLFLQTVRLTNVTGGTRGDFRVFVEGLPAGVELYNGHGEEGGVPYVDFNSELAGGEFVELVLEFFSSTRTAPGALTLSVLDSVANPLNPDETNAFNLDIRSEFVSPTGSLLIEFDTKDATTYVVQYSYNMTDWFTVPSTVAGTGSRVQWIDNGPPKTDCHPAVCTTRFYRIIEQ